MNVVKVDVVVNETPVARLTQKFEKLSQVNRDLENRVSHLSQLLEKLTGSGVAGLDKLSSGVRGVKSAFREAEQAAQKHSETMLALHEKPKMGFGQGVAFQQEQKRFAAESEQITQRRMAGTLAEVNRDRTIRAEERAAHRERVRAIEELRAAKKISESQRDREVAASVKTYRQRISGTDVGRFLTESKKTNESAAAARADQQADVDSFKKSLLTKRELARRNAREELAELKAMRDRGDLTPDQVRAGATGIASRYSDRSGNAAERTRQQTEANRVQAEGVRLTQAHATAQEKHNARQERARQLLKAKAIDEKTFGREVAASNKELEKQGSGGLLSGVKGELTGIAASYVGISATIGFITNRLEQWREANRKLQGESESSAQNIELMRKRFQVQGGMSDADALSGQKRVQAIAQRTATPNDQAFEMAAALQTSGIPAEEASGQVLEQVLGFIKAQGVKPSEVNMSEFAKSLMQFVHANKKSGLKPDMPTLKYLTEYLQSDAVKKHMVKIPDLQFAAQEASGMAEFGVDAATQLGIIPFISDATRIRRGETQVREVSRHLSQSGNSDTAKKALRKLRLKPEQVDLVGENLLDVLELIDSRLKLYVKEKDRSSVMGDIFEGANVGTASMLMQVVPEIRADMTEGFADKTAMPRDVAEMTTGRDSGRIRAENALENSKAERAEYGEAYKRAIEQIGERKKLPADTIQQRLGWYQWHRDSGSTPEQATILSNLGWAGSLGILGEQTPSKMTSGIPGAETDFSDVEEQVRENAGGQNEVDAMKRDYESNKPSAQLKRRASDNRVQHRRAVDAVNRGKGLTIEQRRQKIDYFDDLTSGTGGRSPESVASTMFPRGADRAAFNSEMQRNTLAMEKLTQALNEQNGKPPVNVTVTTKEPVKVQRSKPLPRNSVMLQSQPGARP